MDFDMQEFMTNDGCKIRYIDTDPKGAEGKPCLILVSDVDTLAVGRLSRIA